jgi:hypothetical protein
MFRWLLLLGISSKHITDATVPVLYVPGGVPNPPVDLQYLDVHDRCRGCVGIQGPCITGEWQAESRANNAPHGLLFCTYYGADGACPPHFTDCFAKAHRGAQVLLAHGGRTGGSRLARAHGLRGATANSQGGGVGGGGGGYASASSKGFATQAHAAGMVPPTDDSSQVSELKTSLAMLKIEKQLAALGSTGG